MAVPADDDPAVVAELRGLVIELLEARNAELSGRVAELEERLERAGAELREPGMPPSADDLPGKTSPTPEPGRGRWGGGGKSRQGKQRGCASRPAGEAGTVTYGLNLQAWCVFLLVMHHVPVERCAEVIGALSGSRPSDGFVHAMLARAAKAVRGACMALVITASVLCADKTRCASGRA